MDAISIPTFSSQQSPHLQSQHLHSLLRAHLNSRFLSKFEVAAKERVGNCVLQTL